MLCPNIPCRERGSCTQWHARSRVPEALSPPPLVPVHRRSVYNFDSFARPGPSLVGRYHRGAMHSGGTTKLCSSKLFFYSILKRTSYRQWLLNPCPSQLVIPHTEVVPDLLPVIPLLQFFGRKLANEQPLTVVLWGRTSDSGTHLNKSCNWFDCFAMFCDPSRDVPQRVLFRSVREWTRL